MSAIIVRPIGCMAARKFAVENSRRAISTCASPINARSISVVMTGAGGQVAGAFQRGLEQRHIPWVGVPRDTFNGPRPPKVEFIQNFQRGNPRAEVVVVNTAAIPTGSPILIHKVNVEDAVDMAKAAEKCGSRFVQLSTVATHLPVDERHPYAHSKKRAELVLAPMANVSIFRIGALLGDETGVFNSKRIDLGHLAGVVPLGTAHIKGKLVPFQPTTYTACAQALTAAVMNPDSLPKEVDIVGDATTICEFLRKLNPDRLVEVHFCPDKIKEIARLVENGVLSREFIELGNLSQNHGRILDNSEFRRLHGTPIPTVDEVVNQIRKMSFVERLKMVKMIYEDSADKPLLVKKAFDALLSSSTRVVGGHPELIS